LTRPAALDKTEANPIVADADIPTGADALSIACQACRAELDLHQPRLERPDELLGICTACDAWHFVGLSLDGTPTIARLLATREPWIPGLRRSRASLTIRPVSG
jgi:hypothetical protein